MQVVNVSYPIIKKDITPCDVTHIGPSSVLNESFASLGVANAIDATWLKKYFAFMIRPWPHDIKT